MWVKAGLGLLMLFVVVECQDPPSPSGYRIPRDVTYFITAPQKIRPDQIIQMSVSIINLYYDMINVRAIVRRDQVELAQAQTQFFQPGTQMMQLWIPDNAGVADGNFTLRVEGTDSMDGGESGFLFENETRLIFDTKQLSLFIQLNKPLYRQGQHVWFRVMPVEKTMMSRSGSMDVYVEDATGNIVRRWLSMQTNAGGVLDLDYPLTAQPHYGIWKIRVNAWGHWYEKPFPVNEFWVTAIDVNVSTPLYILEDEHAVAGIICANRSLSLGQPAKGTIKVSLEVRKPGKEQIIDEPETDIPRLEQDVRYFPGFVDFIFTMDEIKRHIAEHDDSEPDDPDQISLANREFYIEGLVYDWFLIQEATGGAITAVYSNGVDMVLLGDQSRTFKPGIPMDVYWAAVNKDGTTFNRDRRQVEITGTEDTTTGSHNIQYYTLIPDDAVVHYRYIPRANAVSVKLNCQYDDMTPSRSLDMVAWRHYSRNDVYVSITTSTYSPQVDQHMVFTIRSNVFVEQVAYVITSGGNILTGNMLDIFGYQTTFSIAVSRDMIPEAHVLVWYIHDGDVITDSLNFFVNGTRLNPVDADFNRGKDFTGDTVEINSWTDPSSYIGWNAIDYELWAYGWNPFITETEMTEELKTYDENVNMSFSHTWKLPEEQTHMIHYPSPCYAIDANKTFEYTGLIVFTDANITRMPHGCNETNYYFPCKNGEMCYRVDQICDGTPQCEDLQDEMGCPSDHYMDPFTEPRNRLGLLTRHYVMVGEWMWKGHFVMPNGRLDVLVEVPDEPMEWVLGAFAISKDLGFGVKHTPSRHQATRPFYMRAEAPATAVKGEQIGVRVGLFNYWDEDLECLLMLHDSDDYKFVVVEEFGIVSSYAPRTIRGDIQIMVYLEKGHVYELQMPILPTRDYACITVTVTAFAFIYGDTEQLEICTKFDGVTNYLHTPYFIDLVNKGSLVIPDLRVPVPEQFVRPEERQHLYVPGSPECYVGISGDVVGPGIFEETLNSETILKKPLGSAEETMYSFAYISYNLLYQKATNQLRQEVLNTSLDSLNLYLQRQLSYMNEDGSFSQFRDYQDFTPSTWVTAFVLRTLQDAHQRDWEYRFYLSTELLNKIGSWLCEQQLPDGTFLERSPVYDPKLFGNKTYNGHEDGYKIALTSYVAIALAQATSLTSSAKSCAESAVSAAKTYLELRTTIDKLKDPYETCIATYALHVLSSPKSTEVYTIMNDMRRTGEFVYWADKEVPPNDVDWVDNIPYYLPRRWYDNEAYAVEATSYALLTYLRRNQIVDSFPVMKWLQSMRNTYAGQASTQDSVNALIALWMYAERDTNRFLYKMQVTVQTNNVGNQTYVVNLDSSNWVDLHEVEIYPVWGSVKGRAEGTGMALMQLSTYVNVEYPHQIKPEAEGKYYDVEVASFNFSGKNFSIMEVRPCARWARPDISNHSGMAVLEMHVPTGYIITNDVLRAYTQSGEVPTLRRAHMYGRKVVFYFDYLESAKATCVNFRMDRWFPVSNMTIQHKLRVFDYYEPGRHNTTLYHTWHLYDLHLCQVCGSFQCPYCRFYNLAPSINVNKLLLLFTSLVALCLTTLSIGRGPDTL